MKKQFLIEGFVFIAASFFISVMIVFLLPIIIGIPLMIAVFIGFMYMAMKRAVNGSEDAANVRFRCVQCKIEHKHDACPNCGSKIKELNSR